MKKKNGEVLNNEENRARKFQCKWETEPYVLNHNLGP